jgi:hypothetical protein
MQGASKRRLGSFSVAWIALIFGYEFPNVLFALDAMGVGETQEERILGVDIHMASGWYKSAYFWWRYLQDPTTLRKVHFVSADIFFPWRSEPFIVVSQDMEETSKQSIDERYRMDDKTGEIWRLPKIVPSINQFYFPKYNILVMVDRDETINEIIGLSPK